MSNAETNPNSPESKPSENPAGNSEIDYSVPKWMISVPWPPDAQGVQDRRAWVAARYPDDVIRKIASAAQFTKTEDIADMRNFLLGTGYWFDDHKNDRHPRASFAPDRDQLEELATLAAKLELALAGMSDVSATSLWHPFHHLVMIHHPSVPSGHVTEFGLTIIKRPQADGSVMVEHLRPHQIEEAIHVLRLLAEGAATSLPEQNGGQQPSSARSDWFMSAQHFWLSHSSLGFDPRSAAFDFCYQGFQPLDSTVTGPEIRSAMRAARKEFLDAKKLHKKPAQES